MWIVGPFKEEKKNIYSYVIFKGFVLFYSTMNLNAGL